MTDNERMEYEDRELQAIVQVKMLRNDFNTFKEYHEKMANERQKNLTESLEKLERIMINFINTCTGPKHSQILFKLIVWCSVLSGLALLNLAFHGINIDLIKLIPSAIR